jgi:hypothetical protein
MGARGSSGPSVPFGMIGQAGFGNSPTGSINSALMAPPWSASPLTGPGISSAPPELSAYPADSRPTLGSGQGQK